MIVVNETQGPLTPLGASVGRNANAMTIRKQIGTMTLAALGARSILDSVDGIQFTIGRPTGGWKVIVKLEANDTYSVEIGRVVDFEYLPKVQAFDVYASELAEAIESAAGEAGALR